MTRMRKFAVVIATVICGTGCAAPAAERGAASHSHDSDVLRVAGPFEVHSLEPAARAAGSSPGSRWPRRW